MPVSSICSKYALIGEDLELKQDVSIEINDNGTISGLNYKNPEKSMISSESNQCYLLLPGFINSHTHVGDNFAKELGFNKELTDIVAPPFGLKHKLLRQTPRNVIIEGIKKAALEMLSNGITCFIDFREGGVDGVNLIKEALEQSSLKCIIFGRFMDESEIDSIFKSADGVGLSSYKRLTNLNKNIVNEAKNKYQKMIACHCAEKNRIPDLIDKIFDDNLVDVIIHGTKFTKPDLDRIQKGMKSLVLCPRSNGYFGVGFPPVTEILKLKLPISLGTDNLMANNPDLFEEMRYLFRISRVLGSYTKDIQLTSKELLKMVTINAAKNFQLEEDFGSISEGKLANFFAIDLKEPNYYTLNLNQENILDVIVQRTRSTNIKRTYIRGEVAFERN
jgi:cytosine/adenosine deaminase-related metal-dependent hydrolase